MEMSKSSWLDAGLFEKVLQKVDEDGTISVSSVTVLPATAKGDNYASDIHRVKIQLSRIFNGVNITETRSVIVKVELRSGIWRETVLNCAMFEQEMIAMTETLPTMNRILAESSTTSLSARCLQVHPEHPMYLILEDLATRGFRMAENRANLDLDHCLLAMRNIAAFHAASVAVAEKDPEAMRKYKKHHKFVKVPASFVAVFKAGVKAVGEEVVNWPELNPRISEKLLKLSEIVWERDCDSGAFIEDDFNVLTHGDFTSINMLFRYNEERKPIEQIFVDFQLCRYGSPATDILYFFATSPSVDVRLDHRDLLLRAYHDSLTGHMTKFKCSTSAPSFDDLQNILRKRAFCEVMPSLIFLPNSLAEKNQVKTIEERIASAGTSDHSVYRGKMFRNVMKRVLPMYETMGLLDP